MSFYPVLPSAAIPDVELIPGVEAVMVAVPVSALVCPVRAGSGGQGRSGLVVAGAGKIETGDPVVWCKAVVVAPAVVRRDGRVQAEGRPCDHARLGAAELELDRRCGAGTIERVAAGVRLSGGEVTGTARREMSVAFTLWALLLMTLMPEADHREVLTALLGDLIGVPWRREHAVVSGTVVSTWRAAIGPVPVQQLQRELLAAVVAELGEHGGDGRAGIEVGGGLRVGAIDGTVTRMPDTKANRGRVRHRRRGRGRLPAGASPACQRRVHQGHPGQRDRPGRWGQGPGASSTCWTGCSPNTPRCSAPTGCGSWTGTFPGCPGSRRCSRPRPTS